MTIARLMQMARAGVPSGGGDVWTDPDLANASYDSVSFSVAGQDTAPGGLHFKPDGTKVYVMGGSGDDVNEYDLSTAWDVSTASYLQNFSVAAQEANPTGVFFKPDGTKMYMTGSNSDAINEYDLSTAWDVSSASYLQNFSVASQEDTPRDVFFKSDGSKMYVTGLTGDDVNEYDLSTAWDVSSASFLQNFSVAAQETLPTALFFSPTGLSMYVLGATGDDVNEYDLSTAWDVSSASFLQNFSVAAQETTPTGLFFKSDGSKMYVVGAGSDSIYQYSTAAAAPAEWTDPDLANASYDSVSFSVAGQDVSPNSLFFNSDGLKLYVLGTEFDSVYEYDLSPTWDIATASFVQSFSVNSQDTSPTGLFFKSDGSKMYVTGAANDSVYEYDLSSAWDVSTASYLQAFSLSAQDATPREIYFKPDGTKMYFIGLTDDEVHEYDLSSAWDVSTASFVQSFSVAAQELTCTGLFFSPTGTTFFAMGVAGDDVNKYSMSTAWDISTASYDSVSFSVASQETVPTGLFFKSDGSKMYIVGSTNDTIYQYSTS